VLRRPLRVRDPVHGFIRYDEVEESLINSRVMQRLRGISQLAFTCYVYPGARHSRFEHSLGVMHIAWRMGIQVGLSEEELSVVRLAGLLHDLGHGPFSHVSDVPLAVLTQEADALPKEIPSSKIHEQITVDLIRQDKELKAILRDKRDAVAEALDTTKVIEKPVLRQVVSGPLDADKLDYLLRDALLAGVRYGVVDLERVLDCFTTIGTHERHLAIRRDGIEAAEQVLIARYQMTRQVYAHRIRRITNVMLQRAILRAARSSRDAGKHIREVYTYRAGDGAWRGKYVGADDQWLLGQLSAFPDTSSVGKLIRRLRSRQLLKQVYECRITELPGAGATARETLVKRIPHQEKLAKRIADATDTDPDLAIVDIRAQDSPLYRPPDIPLEDEIKVVHESGRDERLADMPESLTQKVSVEPEASLYVYIPVDEPDRQKRQKEYAKLECKIHETIESWFKENT